MAERRWTIHFAAAAMRDRYKITRGQAAVFLEAVAVLYQGVPPDAKPVPGAAQTFEYTRHPYRIACQVIGRQAVRVLYFEQID
jgi:hypothetical protein